MEDAMAGTAGMWRSVDSGRGTEWWKESWALFMKNPGIWLVFGVIFFVICAVLGMIPILGGVIAALLTQILIGGWMLSARKLDQGGTVEAGDLFSGFKDKLNPLLVLGAFALIASIITFAVMGVLGMGAFFGMTASGIARSGSGFMASAGMFLLALLVGLVLAFIFAMAFWFAPALIVLRGVQPIDALKASWSASLANIGPFLIYGLLWIVAAVVASIPFGLGWLLLIPLTMLGMYAAYQDIFERQSAAAPMA
jgi:uncharacterized membrane protein